MLVTLGIAILGATIATVAAQLAGYDVDAGDPPPGVTITGTFFQDGGLILSAWLLARLTAGTPSAADVRPAPGRLGQGAGLAVRRLGRVHRLLGRSGPPRSGSRRTTTCRRSSAPTSPRPRWSSSPCSSAWRPRSPRSCSSAASASPRCGAGSAWPAARSPPASIFGRSTPGSADAVFLVPLVVFGALLCLVYRPHGLAAPVHGAARVQQRALARRLPELAGAAGDRADARRGGGRAGGDAAVLAPAGASGRRA